MRHITIDWIIGNIKTKNISLVYEFLEVRNAVEFFQISRLFNFWYKFEVKKTKKTEIFFRNFRKLHKKKINK